MTETLLFGGTFDPVHQGHIAMLNVAQDAIKPNATRILPAGSPWQKGHQPAASGMHRAAMLRLVFPTETIDERELHRIGATYTIDTMRALKAEMPNTNFHWLIGSDSFAKLDSWHEADALVAMMEFVVIRRAGEVISQPHVQCRFRVIDCAPPPISSTQIRTSFSMKRSEADFVPNFVPKLIYDYIQHHKLYQS